MLRELFAESLDFGLVSRFQFGFREGLRIGIAFKRGRVVVDDKASPPHNYTAIVTLGSERLIAEAG